ncbi:MAG: hypothetical protein AAGG38_02850 [Planctomycetota bacterium]
MELKQIWGASLFAVLLMSAPRAVADPSDQPELFVAAERGGVVAVEAEHYAEQTEDQVRAWHRRGAGSDSAEAEPDGGESHADGASGGAYLELLPDTRRTHADPLVPGENFSNEPGKLAVLHYPVRFETAGRYYVWARIFSTGTEDNGLHVGHNGTWPGHGRRMQWCAGKHAWRWESRQRTTENHCGVPHMIYLDIAEPGVHVVSFSMREDGVEFDKFLLINRRLDTLEGPAPEHDLASP